RNHEGDEKPLEVAGLGQREIVRVALCLLDAVELEDDRDAGLIGASVVLSHDPRFPQPPHVGDLLREHRLDRLHGHPGLESVISKDPHRASLKATLGVRALRRNGGYTPRASMTILATSPPEYCCWPVMSRPSRTANALKRPPWM